MFAVTISDGNLRIVRLSAELNASYSQDSPLEEYADRWKYIPIKALTWHRSNQITFQEMPISYVAVGGSLIAPVAVILAFFLIVWVVRQRRHAVKTIRRVIRRSVVVILGLATVARSAERLRVPIRATVAHPWVYDTGRRMNRRSGRRRASTEP